MRLRIAAYAALLVALFAWPPIYHLCFAKRLEVWRTGLGRMEDFEIQILLGAQRWEMDVPIDKDGWILGFETVRDSDVRTTGGSSVAGGSRVILLTRRNTDTKRIEFAWYSAQSTTKAETNGPISFRWNLRSTGSGSFVDPLAEAGVTAGRPDGEIKIGEPIYRGGRKSVQGFPGQNQADFEVRVVLTPLSDEPE